jgi:hypothetical protein
MRTAAELAFHCLQFGAWIWGGVGVMILSAVILNAGVIFALTYLRGAHAQDYVSVR